jgi:hypothetical protein
MADIYKAAFVDSNIASHIQLSSTKVHYMLLFGLAPYFKYFFLIDCKAGAGYMTLYFDETTTSQVKKQLDMHIGYWSKKFNQIAVIYVHSAFLGHAEADKLKDVILKFLDDNNLHASKLFHCSMDGPAVNKSLFKKLKHAPLKKYFLTVLPKSSNCKATCAADRYKCIKAILENGSTLAYLNFIVYLFSCVTPFLALFQKEDPLVHVMHDSLNDLVQSPMLKFMEHDSVEGKM